MADRVFEIEHRPGEELVLRFKLASILPEEARGHFRMARKEALLALRSLLDKAIERTEKAEKAKERTKIEVQ
jgi:hypothetical protein